MGHEDDALRKAFISVKGIYYRLVHGQEVTWLAPHALHQTLPEDVDYVMLAFLEFYLAMMGRQLQAVPDRALPHPPLLDTSSRTTPRVVAVIHDRTPSPR